MILDDRITKMKYLKILHRCAIVKYGVIKIIIYGSLWNSLFSRLEPKPENLLHPARSEPEPCRKSTGESSATDFDDSLDTVCENISVSV